MGALYNMVQPFGAGRRTRTHTSIAFETTAFTDYTIGPYVAETVGVEPTYIGVKDRRLNRLAKSLYRPAKTTAWQDGLGAAQASPTQSLGTG